MVVIQDLILHNNPNLDGTIPTEFGNMLGLEKIELSHTAITGGIPTELAKLESLETFDASKSQIFGIH